MLRPCLTPTIALAAALFLTTPLAAQLPSADWRTATTENFRVHYPAPWEPWALELGGRLESILEVVSGEVGYRLEQPIDVVIADPESQSNGSAWPLLGAPRTVFWTRPPVAGSILSHATDWGELLAIHEIAHLVHLGRPSRNPRRALLEHIAPFGPITRKAPRWVFEGYATVVEGRLTGSGRPFGDLRAAIIRKWALAGRLPSYSALASDSRNFLGQSMAYLVGSAYLEWLERRVEPGSLPRLWRRLSARTDRGFDDAFRGVYGATPSELYGRFVAETTAHAFAVEAEVAPVGREGKLWLDLGWFTGAPAVSPDGKYLVAIRAERERPARLVVWDVGEDAEALQTRETRLAEMIARDPEDVAPIAAALPSPRKVVNSLEAPLGVPIAGGRWTADSKQVLFTRFERGSDGQRHGDLFLWTVESGAVRRVTHGADVSDADPAPNGDWAVAVQSRFGATGLVRVDLITGGLDELLPLEIARGGELEARSLVSDRVVDRPRVSRDGAGVAFLAQVDGVWTVRMMSVNRRSWMETEAPMAGRVMDIAWSASGEHLYAVVGRGGLVDIEALPITIVDFEAPPPQWHQVTRSLGPVAGVAPTPDGTALFFLALDPDGVDIRRLPLDAATEQLPELMLGGDLAPVAPSVPPAPAVLGEQTVAPGDPYGWGRPEWQGLVGGFGATDGGAFEFGVRAGDLIGRWSVLALGGVGEALGPRGGAIAFSTERFAVDLGVFLYDLDTRPAATDDSLGALDATAQGAQLRVGREFSRGPVSLAVGGGLLLDELEGNNGEAVERQLGFAEIDLGARFGRGRLRFEPTVAVAATASLGGDDSSEWRKVEVGFGLGYGRHRAHIQWRQVDTGHEGVFAFERPSLGGTPSSLVPRSFEIGWLSNPALPRGALVGDQIESQTLRLSPASLPVSILAERHRLEGGEWLRLAGLEWRVAIDAMPLLRLPALEARIGVAQIFDAPFEDETRWWAGLVVRP